MTMFSKTLTIADGDSVSDEMDFNELRFAGSLAFYAPAVVAGTVTVEVAPVRNPGASDWRTLQSDGVDVELTAGNVTLVIESGFFALRLATSVAPTGSDEVYQVVVNEE